MSSTGETSLLMLLRTLKVSVDPSSFTFLSLPADSSKALNLNFGNAGIRMLFYEPHERRYSLIIDSSQIDEVNAVVPHLSGADKSPVEWKMLTLNVHSSLEAVGFMATISEALAEAEISCNCVAAYFHDHIFVQADKVEAARIAIEQVAQKRIDSADGN